MKRFSYILIVLIGLAGVSCDDFLDKLPDNRAEIKTPKQVSLLLVNGYSEGNYALLGELSSDNVIDNNSPDDKGMRHNVPAFNKMDDEVYAWEDVVSSDQQDSPSEVWVGAYHAIAVANHALEAIKKFEEEGRGSEVRAQKGEALLIRAYNHFILVNVFAQAYRNEKLSANDPGIPYITEPERKVMVIKERISVDSVYKLIEKDLLAGLPLINDAMYEVPKYHFNRAAANAFAARFFLFKKDYDKAIEYASAVLEPNPALMMRKWWSITFPTSMAQRLEWINAAETSNLMLIATHSIFARRYNSSPRYAINRDALNGTIYSRGPTWSGSHPCFRGRLYISWMGQEYGVFFLAAVGELFEYTDKIAGIGYPRIVRPEFTAEETLLCRAEAYIYQERFDKALEDLKVWDKARQNLPTQATFSPFTEAAIQSLYRPTQTLLVKTLNTTKMDPAWTISERQEYFLHCVLHFRRIETISNGMRWFDVKRYGIELEHKIGTSRVETLTWDDPRRALQLPAEVIAAGMEPNDRRIKVEELPEDAYILLVSPNVEVE
ncbi:MAG: RagB/SusD family nutrient uptake outer membrane protein [Dysgonamonadaceae bacterium]|jgi:tetratricopeptide (TPR) repeat protein|nr:RagB/SusD family nutrient uptake outer membrane protein [Dysgonamonadaceae bacterium]